MDINRLTDQEIQKKRVYMRYNREKLTRAVYVAEKLGLSDEDAVSSKLYWKMLVLVERLLHKRDDQEQQRKEATLTELLRGWEE